MKDSETGAGEVVAGTGMVGALRVVFDTSMQNTEKIENFCKEQGISLLGRIPFDSDAVKAINNGQTIVDIDCASGAAVMAVYSKTMKLLFERRGRVEVMIIKTLVENTALSKKFGSEHGLSLYIEANSRKILFDVGAGDLFLENAKKLNVDIPEVDYLIISHGHYDHGGGLRAFLRVNTKTEVFLHRLAFEKYYASRLNEKLEYIGLDEELKQNRQVVLTSDRFFINRGIQVFSNINRKESPLKLNSSLFMEHDGKIAQDTFAHEQNLIIEEAGKTLLVTGCAHNGIVNILEHFHDLKGRMPDYVVGGFHLSSRSGGNEVREMIDRIGKYLVGTKAKFYTCHCTGIEPYNRLKAAMGDSIDYLSTGSEIVI